jgi:hypothetical protein
VVIQQRLFRVVKHHHFRVKRHAESYFYVEITAVLYLAMIVVHIRVRSVLYRVKNSGRASTTAQRRAAVACAILENVATAK